MLIERPMRFMRKLASESLFRVPTEGRKVVFLTFDDGPIPEVTPWLLDVLDKHGVKGTFFMVGDNVRKYPELYEEVLRRGHRVGNHTMHHLQGMRTRTDDYISDVEEAGKYIDSELFRPPHGWMWRKQRKRLKDRYRLVMYDLVTRDYSKRMSAEDVFNNVRKYSRPGSIIVFHDSLKSKDKLTEALPKSIEWLKKEGYEFEKL